MFKNINIKISKNMCTNVEKYGTIYCIEYSARVLLISEASGVI